MFSQHNEEEVILANSPDYGTFLDIGAYTGVDFSNTRALALKGWSGVCVEPSPIPFVALMNLYKNNPKIMLVNALVIPNTIVHGMVKFQSTPDALGTADEENYEKWKSVGQFQEIWIPTLPICELIRGRQFDVISIDTEGTSVDLLKQLLPSTGRLICVEYDNRKSEVEEWFQQCNFSILYDDGTNMIGKRNA